MINEMKTFLIVPSVPTPNGPLHLGHIGGPYLSADILARYLRMRGNRALIISGTDSYESYVTARASKENQPISDICNYYHHQIDKDLKAMQIEMNAFVNPLSEQWDQMYRQWHYHILHKLRNQGSIQEINEIVLWDHHSKRYLTGCWLNGQCPLCRANVTGYFCENCGGHFRPEEVVHQYSYAVHTVKNLFLCVPTTGLVLKGINYSIRERYQHYIRQQNGLLRLTANSDWGLPYSESARLFNYGFMFAYFLMLGEIARVMLGASVNAFQADSDIVTIASFGVDNAVPFLASAHGITAACQEYKTFDYYLVNYFYHLEGSKFSTSRRHAVWVNDIVDNKGLTSDIVRFYLASINVREGSGNFSLQDFLSCNLNTRNWIQQRINNVLPVVTLPGSGVMDSVFMRQLDEILLLQYRALDPEQFAPHEVTPLIHAWLEFGNSIAHLSENYFWWLKGLCLLIYPVMPYTGQQLWEILGYAGMPRINGFNERPELPIQRNKQINTNEINPDLHLRENKYDKTRT